MATFIVSILLPLLAVAKSLPAGNLFSSEEPLKLTLKYDVHLLQGKKASLREKGLPGTIQIDNKTLKVSVMPRGGGSFSCKQPQLKIDFSKAPTSETPFEGFKKIKLFTSGRCLDNKTDAETDKKILSNYLIYKLYEQVFPIHFKTRLAEISYVDVSGKTKPYTQLAFFMEPEKHIEPRLQLKRIEPEELITLNEKIPALTNPESVSLMHAFQFFIGNFDYGIPGFYSHILQGTYPNEKNIQLYQDAQGQLIPIAYDWDFSRFNYMGPVCNVSVRFFADGAVSADCSPSELRFVYEDDFVAFRYKIDLIRHLPRLQQAFQQWRETNKANIEKLGSMYSEELDSFTAAFEPVIFNLP